LSTRSVGREEARYRYALAGSVACYAVLRLPHLRFLAGLAVRWLHPTTERDTRKAPPVVGGAKLKTFGLSGYLTSSLTITDITSSEMSKLA
jgi:hypothetical protein